MLAAQLSGVFITPPFSSRQHPHPEQHQTRPQQTKHENHFNRHRRTHSASSSGSFVQPPPAPEKDSLSYDYEQSPYCPPNIARPIQPIRSRAKSFNSSYLGEGWLGKLFNGGQNHLPDTPQQSSSSSTSSSTLHPTNPFISAPIPPTDSTEDLGQSDLALCLDSLEDCQTEHQSIRRPKMTEPLTADEFCWCIESCSKAIQRQTKRDLACKHTTPSLESDLERPIGVDMLLQFLLHCRQRDLQLRPKTPRLLASSPTIASLSYHSNTGDYSPTFIAPSPAFLIRSTYFRSTSFPTFRSQDAMHVESVADDALQGLSVPALIELFEEILLTAPRTWMPSDQFEEIAASTASEVSEMLSPVPSDFRPTLVAVLKTIHDLVTYETVKELLQSSRSTAIGGFSPSMLKAIKMRELISRISPLVFRSEQDQRMIFYSIPRDIDTVASLGGSSMSDADRARVALEKLSAAYEVDVKNAVRRKLPTKRTSIVAGLPQQPLSPMEISAAPSLSLPPWRKRVKGESPSRNSIIRGISAMELGTGASSLCGSKGAADEKSRVGSVPCAAGEKDSCRPSSVRRSPRVSTIRGGAGVAKSTSTRATYFQLKYRRQIRDRRRSKQGSLRRPSLPATLQHPSDGNSTFSKEELPYSTKELAHIATAEPRDASEAVLVSPTLFSSTKLLQSLARKPMDASRTVESALSTAIERCDQRARKKPPPFKLDLSAAVMVKSRSTTAVSPTTAESIIIKLDTALAPEAKQKSATGKVSLEPTTDALSLAKAKRKWNRPLMVLRRTSSLLTDTGVFPDPALKLAVPSVPVPTSLSTKAQNHAKAQSSQQHGTKMGSSMPLPIDTYMLSLPTKTLDGPEIFLDANGQPRFFSAPLIDISSPSPTFCPSPVSPGPSSAPPVRRKKSFHEMIFGRRTSQKKGAPLSPTEHVPPFAPNFLYGMPLISPKSRQGSLGRKSKKDASLLNPGSIPPRSSSCEAYVHQMHTNEYTFSTAVSGMALSSPSSTLQAAATPQTPTSSSSPSPGLLSFPVKSIPSFKSWRSSSRSDPRQHPMDCNDLHDQYRNDTHDLKNNTNNYSHAGSNQHGSKCEIEDGIGGGGSLRRRGGSNGTSSKRRNSHQYKSEHHYFPLASLTPLPPNTPLRTAHSIADLAGDYMSSKYEEDIPYLHQLRLYPELHWARSSYPSQAGAPIPVETATSMVLPSVLQHPMGHPTVGAFDTSVGGMTMNTVGGGGQEEGMTMVATAAAARVTESAKEEEEPLVAKVMKTWHAWRERQSAR